MGIISEIILGEIGKSVIRGKEDDRIFGYDLAANICIDVIDKKINELNERMNLGKFLKNEEQFLLGRLNALRNEIENELREGIREIEIRIGEN